MTRRSPPPVDPARLRSIRACGSRGFWSGLEELIDEGGFRRWIAGECPAAAPFVDDPGRRQVLKLLGASLLLGGLAGCGESRSDQALPYVNQPDGLVPGVPRHYATAVLFGGHAQPVIATTYDGRPVKLDGNPDHPVTRGSSDPFMQSAVFDLYDPDRSQLPRRDGAPSTWDAFARDLASLRIRWRDRQGEGLRVLTGAVTSPTLLRQMQALSGAFPQMRWHRFDPVGMARQMQGMAMAFGRPATPHYNLERCDVIVSLSHDLLGPGPHQVTHAGAWSSRRGETASRVLLHVAESVPSLTGAVASTRLPCDPSRLGRLARAMGATFEIPGWTAPDLTPAERRWLDRAIGDLRTHAGRSLLTIGPCLDPHFQALAPFVNGQLGNAGTTVWYSEPIEAVPGESETLAALTADMAAGAVDTLVILDCNPAYAAPAALEFAVQLAKVPHRVHAGLHADETARLCQWHLPLSHPLESFGDARAIDGQATILQPVVAPLYASHSLWQIADMLLGTADPAPDAAVRDTWRGRLGGDSETGWSRALHDGFVAGTQAQPATLAARTPAAPPDEGVSDALNIVLQPDPTVWDGRFGNIAWLQELPKPLSKITWDNVVAVSPAIAASHGLSNGDMVTVTAGDRTVHGPAWIAAGQAPGTVALTFGYGRRAGGDVAAGIGYDAFAIQPGPHSFVVRGTLARTGATYPLASSQSHHRMEGFDFVREVSAAHPRTALPKAAESLYPDWNAGDMPENAADHAWGMVIDLDQCIGCNACIAACNVENNVLTVGKDQIMRGREMLWLRVDSYDAGEADSPKTFFQPVPCMHCEKAPCEMGCPVHATVHSPEGVNQQIYNRCIGTRTCSSYCPYKVRRFNWYDYRHFGEAARAAMNPEVTVRSRGVMEKCTYCTQRIETAHVAADKENRDLRRDEVVTACQQACPTTAIVFGDLKDSGSAVAQRRRSGRHYVLLEELGTRPRTTYLARWNDAEDDT